MKKRTFDVLLTDAGAKPDTMASPSDDIRGEHVPSSVPIEHVPDTSLSLKSRDELAGRLDTLEKQLTQALTLLSSEEQKRDGLGFYTVLHPSFWIKLGREGERNLAQEYQDIHDELENRKSE